MCSFGAVPAWRLFCEEKLFLMEGDDGGREVRQLYVPDRNCAACRLFGEKCSDNSSKEDSQSVF